MTNYNKKTFKKCKNQQINSVNKFKKFMLT